MAAKEQKKQKNMYKDRLNTYITECHNKPVAVKEQFKKKNMYQETD